jgi:hypothetical protein
MVAVATLSRRKFMKPPVLVTLLFLLISGSPAAEPDETSALRDRVLKATKPDEKAAAYKALFTKVGKAGLAGLMKDEDTGIALQAAWELHKSPAKRATAIDHRTGDFYDSGLLKKFLGFLEVRTKAPVPGWWAGEVVAVELFPGRHHAFVGDGMHHTWKLSVKAGYSVPEGAELERKGDTLVYTTGGRSVEFPRSALPIDEGYTVTGVITERGAALAVSGFSGGGGVPFMVVGFTGKGGRPAWVADVWAAGRTMLDGWTLHRVDLVEKDGTLFVFGAEGFGAYLEAFDLATGRCLYRFCTCYWFNFSETWDLK